MPEKVTWEEKVVELAIRKAKEVLQEANVNTLELDVSMCVDVMIQQLSFLQEE